MEETTTSWKNHSFTLLVFGGIVVLCSIFFVLGMLVGRNQGQRIAETAYAEKEKNKPVAVASADDFSLNYQSETTEEKASDARPQPEPVPPPVQPPVSDEPKVTGGSSTSAKSASSTGKSQPTVKPSSLTKAKPKPPAPASTERYLQVASTQDRKQANEALKKVQLKGFKGLIMDVTLSGEKWHRVVVGPYKESEIALKTSDLKAKGYTRVIPR